MVRVEFGTYTNKIPVTKAKNITDAIDIKAGKNHTVILKSTGEVYVTGSNLYGELGQNDVNIRKVKEFTKVPDLGDIVKIGVRRFTKSSIKIRWNSYDLGLKHIQTIGNRLK